MFKLRKLVSTSLTKGAIMCCMTLHYVRIAWKCKTCNLTKQTWIDRESSISERRAFAANGRTRKRDYHKFFLHCTKQTIRYVTAWDTSHIIACIAISSWSFFFFLTSHVNVRYTPIITLLMLLTIVNLFN